MKRSFAGAGAAVALAACSNVLGLQDLELDPGLGDGGALTDAAGDVAPGADASQGDAQSDAAPGVDGAGSPDGADGGTSSDGSMPADSGNDTGADASCPGTEMFCNGSCIQVQTSHDDCGSCNHSCLAGSCMGGVCVAGTLATGQNAPWGIASDGVDVFWTNSGDGSVEKCAVTGCSGNPTQLATAQGSPYHITLDATYAYFTDYGTGASDGYVMRVRKDGTVGPSPLESSQNLPFGVAVDGMHLYFTKRETPGDVFSANVAGGAVTVFRTDSSPTYVLVDSGYVFWGNDQGVVKTCVAGAACMTPTTLYSDPGGNEAAFLAVDGSNFYAAIDDALGAIVRGARGGQGAVWVSNQSSPTSVAVDADNAYWTNRGSVSNNGSVMACSKTTCANNPQTIAGSLQTPQAVAVDSLAIYWVETGAGTVWQLAK